ncbi:MAG: hypothetical protein GY728_10310, partial [Phycisphaeraceae bacterium]|nr:hypothetical protein [Phycisphaeraceae bacterium]
MPCDHLQSVSLLPLSRGLGGLFVAGALAVATSVMAGTDDPTPPTPEMPDVDALAAVADRPVLDVTLGIWFPRLEGTIDIGPDGTPLDAGDDLSLDDSQAIFNGEARVQAGRWEFLIGGYVLEAEGQATLARAARIGGLFAPAGTAVASNV